MIEIYQKSIKTQSVFVLSDVTSDGLGNDKISLFTSCK